MASKRSATGRDRQYATSSARVSKPTTDSAFRSTRTASISSVDGAFFALPRLAFAPFFRFTDASARYDRFIVIRKMPFVSVFSSRFRSSSTASTGFMSLSTRRSM